MSRISSGRRWRWLRTPSLPESAPVQPVAKRPPQPCSSSTGAGRRAWTCKRRIPPGQRSSRAGLARRPRQTMLEHRGLEASTAPTAAAGLKPGHGPWWWVSAIRRKAGPSGCPRACISAPSATVPAASNILRAQRKQPRTAAAGVGQRARVHRGRQGSRAGQRTVAVARPPGLCSPWKGAPDARRMACACTPEPGGSRRERAEQPRCSTCLCATPGTET